MGKVDVMGTGSQAETGLFTVIGDLISKRIPNPIFQDTGCTDEFIGPLVVSGTE